MMYFIQEIQSDNKIKKTAGTKARDDISTILSEIQCQKILLENDTEARKTASPIKKLKWHFDIRKLWQQKTTHLKQGDILIIQFPIVNHSLVLGGVINKLQKHGIKIALLIHDVDTLRVALRDDMSSSRKFRMKHEEQTLLAMADYIIAHNEKMKDKFISLGYKESRILVLEIFDYLSEADYATAKVGLPIVIAGNLRPHKAQYAYHLPDNYEYNLYGVDYSGEKKNNVHYFGAFPPDQLPAVLKGSFGLVWDGESTKTCSGTYGEYLRINNPHKASLYLASGLPIAIWKDAALADFVTRNKCGVTISSLEELGELCKSISEEEYQEIKNNCLTISKRLRDGYYTKKVIEKM